METFKKLFNKQNKNASEEVEKVENKILIESYSPVCNIQSI